MKVGWALGLGLTRFTAWRSGCLGYELSTEFESPPGTHRSGERDLIGACLRGPSLSCPPSRHVRPPLLAANRRRDGDDHTGRDTDARHGWSRHTPGCAHGGGLDQRGAELGIRPFSTDPAGHRELLAWLESLGSVERIGVEGTGTYGAGLTRFLHEHDVVVVEVRCPDRQERRSHGKSDPVDALAAARAAQSGKAKAKPKARTGNVEAIRALRLVRRSATGDRTAAVNQMRALVVTGPADLRETFRGVTLRKLVTGAARLRPADPTTPDGATRFALRELARRVQFLETEISRINSILTPLVAATAPTLVARYGVGTDTAATLLISAGDNPGRLRNEASFAHLCGSAPIDASSGLIKRKRLNPRGDRSANEALWRIVMVRMSSDPRTRIYVERRTLEGKSKREIIRCLKRYVAREVFADLALLQQPLDAR
jgi:transposase